MSERAIQKTGLVIMASGLGKRFGGNKLMEIVKDKPLIQHVLDTTNSLFDERVVVTRSKEVKALCDSLGVNCIIHKFPYRSDTVRLGLSFIKTKADFCFFTPGDQPLIGRDTFEKLIDEACSGKKIVRTAYEDILGSPIGFDKVYFDELLKLPEGKGGNFIAKKYETEVSKVQVQNEYELWDVDTIEDLEKIKHQI